MPKNSQDRSAATHHSSDNDGFSKYPGEKLGLAASGPASMASYGQRIGAIMVDWFIATGMTWFIVGTIESGAQWLVLTVFGLFHWFGIAFLGTTVGKAIFRTQVVQVGGARTGMLKALIRTVLLLIVIPVVIVDGDGRGLHDKVAGTVEIRM